MYTVSLVLNNNDNIILLVYLINSILDSYVTVLILFLTLKLIEDADYRLTCDWLVESMIFFSSFLNTENPFKMRAVGNSPAMLDRTSSLTLKLVPWRLVFLLHSWISSGSEIIRVNNKRSYTLCGYGCVIPKNLFLLNRYLLWIRCDRSTRFEKKRKKITRLR